MPAPMIELDGEECFSASAFAKMFGITRAVLGQYSIKGMHGIKLPRRRVGGCHRYTRGDYIRWLAAVDQAKARDSAPDKKQRKRRDKAAFEVLAREGMLPGKKK